LFPNVHLPGGISSEATKYKQMAREGDEWRSPIFDIGSAKPSSNIPKPKKITRRSPHQHTRATINDREGTATNNQGLNPGSSQYGSKTGSTGYGSNTGSNTGSQQGYTSLNSGGYDSGRNGGGFIPSGGFGNLSNTGNNGYQPRSSVTADSMRTAVEQEDFEGTHVGKYNVTGSQLPQDPVTMPYSGAKDTHVASQDPSRQVY
jgi:hypothetical protein